MLDQQRQVFHCGSSVGQLRDANVVPVHRLDGGFGHTSSNAAYEPVTSSASGRCRCRCDLVEEVAITPANINDGKEGTEALPDDPRVVFAGHRLPGKPFGDAVRAKGGVPHMSPPARGDAMKPETLKGRSVTFGPASRDLRHVEAQLRHARDAMTRPCQSCLTGSHHRQRLQLQTHD